MVMMMMILLMVMSRNNSGDNDAIYGNKGNEFYAMVILLITMLMKILRLSTGYEDDSIRNDIQENGIYDKAYERNRKGKTKKIA